MASLRPINEVIFSVDKKRLASEDGKKKSTMLRVCGGFFCFLFFLVSYFCVTNVQVSDEIKISFLGKNIQ